jgi:hypothetical protein
VRGLILKRWIDITLGLLFVVFLAAVVLGSEDPSARIWVCERIRLCPAHASGWRKLFYDLGVGGLTSLFFYGLLVRLPEFERRNRIKRSFRDQYRAFKWDCISTILGVVDGTHATKTVEELLDQKKFRAYFKQEVSYRHDKWMVFINELREHNLSDLLVAMEIFRGEVLYVLNNTDVANEQTLAFLKRISAAIFALQQQTSLEQRTTRDYDAVKQLGGFFWELLAGWNFVEGYQDEDFVEKMIRSI